MENESPDNYFHCPIALAMDAFYVSIASGIAIKELQMRHALTIAAWFGLFQAIMPLLGWFGGMKLRAFIANLDLKYL